VWQVAQPAESNTFIPALALTALALDEPPVFVEAPLLELEPVAPIR
jgi:hypothetical protein